MACIGYARVSTIDRDVDIQLAKLKAEGCTMIRSEKVSGGSREGRPELATVLDFLRDGDELVVARFDRLGRDTRDMLNLLHECEQRGAWAMVITVLGMLAQMERPLYQEAAARRHRAGKGWPRLQGRDAAHGPSQDRRRTAGGTKAISKQSRLDFVDCVVVPLCRLDRATPDLSPTGEKRERLGQGQAKFGKLVLHTRGTSHRRCD